MEEEKTARTRTDLRAIMKWQTRGTPKGVQFLKVAENSRVRDPSYELNVKWLHLKRFLRF